MLLFQRIHESQSLVYCGSDYSLKKARADREPAPVTGPRQTRQSSLTVGLLNSSVT
jgi:hypothetical protein